MIIVLDTNVLIAGFIGRGLCADLMEISIRLHQLAVSGHIIAEFREHLTERFGRRPGTVLNAVQWLRANATEVEPAILPSPVCRDPDDDPVIGTAVAARAGARDARSGSARPQVV